MSAQSPRALFAAGLARHRAGDIDAALPLLRAAAEQGRDPAPARILALLLAERGEAAAALRWISRALALGHGEAASHAAHGRVLSVQALWAEAITAFGAALSIEPDLAAAQAGLSHAYRAYAASLAADADTHRLAAAARAHPRAGEIRHAHGQALCAAGDWAKAACELAEAALLLPGDAAVRHDWGTALHEAGRPAEAIPAYLESLARDPAQARTWHNLGSSRQALGDMEGALCAYGRACALDPAGFPRVAQELAAGNPGRVWLRAGDLRRCLAASAVRELPPAGQPGFQQPGPP